jgi:hypothetical protein
MREDAFQFQVGAIRQRARDARDVRGRYAQPVHARVDFEMKGNRAVPRAGCGVLQQP